MVPHIVVSVLVAMLVAGLACTAHAGGDGGPSVVEITDETFDELTWNSTWMINVYAPWCPHCKQLEPTWRALADDARDHNLGFKVGKIDGEQQKILQGRLYVKSYPAIYLLRDGHTYEYQGPRSLEALKRFALAGYRYATPWPLHKAPNSIVGRFMGKLRSTPLVMRRVYRYLHNDRGLSDLTIVLAVLAVPVTVGAVCICALDALYVRRAREEVPMHEHQE